MERWYLLITEKFLFWNFQRWEIHSFFGPKLWWKHDIYLVFLSFPWYSRTWKIWFFVQCQIWPRSNFQPITKPLSAGQGRDVSCWAVIHRNQTVRYTPRTSKLNQSSSISYIYLRHIFFERECALKFNRILSFEKCYTSTNQGVSFTAVAYILGAKTYKQCR